MEFSIFNIFTLFGGVAIFLYGMNIMGSSLEKLAGGKLEKILEKLTDNRFKAILLGAGITAVIQSSSATTVMLVGFVNSGIMKLSQVIGVIIGSNIGTTITAWILSLTGINSSNFFVNFLKPTSFSPILAVIGIIFIMFIKSERKNVIGNILIGFALLMFGMETMSGAVSPLKDVPAFQDLFVKFSFPLLGILVGALLTAIIQSSSASVGILQALTKTGAITYNSALPIIMGQNIGTCITALISSVGASKNAKRVAIVHLYFNVIGTIAICLLYYSLNSIIDFSFANDTASELGIAVIHTLFNVIATIILIPFMKQLENLARKTIKDSPDDENQENEFALLDSRLMTSPTFAIEHCQNLVVEMAELSNNNFKSSLNLQKSYSKDIAKQILEVEEKVDLYDDKISSYLVKLSSKNLSFNDSRKVSLLQHSINDIERISDHAVNMVEIAKQIHKKDIIFSDKAKKELDILYDALTDILSRTITAFTNNDIELAKTVEPLEEVIDSLCYNMKKKHTKRLKKGKCSYDTGFAYTDILINGERIADHCSNIAISLIQIDEDNLDAHGYLKNLKNTQDQIFEEKLAFFEKKYLLAQEAV